MTVNVYFVFILIFKSVVGITFDRNFVNCWRIGSFDSQLVGMSFNCKTLENHSEQAEHFDSSVVNDTCYVYLYPDSTYKSFAEAFQLNFDNCQLPKIPQKFFERLGKIHELKLSQSAIEAISKENFVENCKLEKLWVSHNNLKKVPALLFSHTPIISEVDFSYNHIEDVDPDAFRGTNKTLKTINLAHNTIDTINELMFTELINLEKLDLSYNFIKSFQADLYPVKSLSELRLDNNQINQLNCSIIFNLQTKNTSIDLSMNQLEMIDLNCTTYAKSIDLHVEDNHLKTLDFPKTRLVNSLKAVFASRNKISTITFEREMNNLKQLKVANNSLTNASNIFHHCYYLEMLDLSFNDNRRMKIDSIPRMPHLQLFYLNNMNLSTIDLATISYSKNLKELDISHNKLKKIGFDLLPPYFENLIDLRLNDNYLTDLDGWTKAIFPKLSVFSFSNNHFNCSYLDQFLRTFPRIIQLLRYPALPVHESHNRRKNIHGISCVDHNIDIANDNLHQLTDSICSDSKNSQPIVVIVLLIFLSSVCLVFVITKVVDFFKKNRTSRPEFDVIYRHDNVLENTF